eukprot:6546830-Prymnesium_polylepis.1
MSIGVRQRPIPRAGGRGLGHAKPARAVCAPPTGRHVCGLPSDETTAWRSHLRRSSSKTVDLPAWMSRAVSGAE